MRRLPVYVVSLLISIVLLTLLIVYRILLTTTMWLHGSDNFDLWLYIPLLQFIALAFIGLTLRGNWSWKRAVLSLTPPGIVLTATYLFMTERLDQTLVWICDFLASALLPVSWVCLFFLLYGARREFRQRREQTHGRGLLKTKLACSLLLFLVTSELTARSLRVEAKVAPLAKLPDSYQTGNADEFRIASIGASTMVGSPYHPKISIPVFLREMLHATDPSRRIIVDNVAEVGINLHMAIEHMKKIQVRPDVLIIYSGHNEYFYDLPFMQYQLRWPRRVIDPWMQWSQAYRMLVQLVPKTGVPKHLGPLKDSFLRDSVVTQLDMPARVARFRDELQRLIAHCQKHEIAILWYLPAYNEGVFSPSRSTCVRPLTIDEELELNDEFRRCLALIDRSDFEEALRKLDAISRDYPEIAEVEYYRGICYRELNQIDQARKLFHLAGELDRHPPHITEDYQATIRDLAAEHNIELIDTADVLRNLSSTGLVDTAVIQDYVHPTLQAYFALARAAYQSNTIRGEFRLTGQSQIPISFAQAVERTGFTAEDLATAYERTAFGIEFMSKYQVDWTRKRLVARQFRDWVEQLRLGEIEPGARGTEGFSNESAPGVEISTIQ